MRLSELQYKDIVNLNGKKVGNIIDVKLDSSGRLMSLIIEEDKKFFKLKNQEVEYEIPWEKIEKIGEDVILVKI